MLADLTQLLLFTAKAIIIVILILFLMAGILSLLSRGKKKLYGKMIVKNLNKKYLETTETLLGAILPKKKFKKSVKGIQEMEKRKKGSPDTNKYVFVLNFHGDMHATAVASLREEITAILAIATPKDEVVVRLDSGGGVVQAYGLATAQLMRLREQKIPLTVIVDKVAASGGYLMACVANKILAAPFAILGSIGVATQLPNFHRLLKEKHIDYEQITAGNFKRTLTVFGPNTTEGREKVHQELEEVHQLFKQSILQYRQHIDIEKVATGECWLGTHALELKLIDGIQTSDDYLLAQSKVANLYEINFHIKKSLSEKLASTILMRRFF